jgi:hypothetical protein
VRSLRNLCPRTPRGRRRTTTALIAGGLLLSAALAGCSEVARSADQPCDPAERRPEGAGPMVGAQFHGAWDDYTDAERSEVIGALAATGMEWVRIDVPWSSLEPRAAGDWDPAQLAALDTSVELAVEQGLEVLVTVLDTPRWAGGGTDGLSPPTDPGSYADVVGALAGRYAGRVAAWEIWNEPNSPEFFADGDPEAYAELLGAAAPAVRAADPAALVVFGGTQYNDAEFVEAVYAAGAAGTFDVLATHPYPAPSDAAPSAEDDGTEYSLGHVATVREVMEANGDDDLPVWFTEIGWSTHPNDGSEEAYERGVTEERQAGYLLRTLELVRTELPYVEQVIWYAERDRREGDPQIANFGLFGTDLRPKPAVRALTCYLGG